MTDIVFDVLVPDEQAERVAEIFDAALSKLVDARKLAAGTVALEPNPRLYAGLEEQLRATYREQHEDRDLDYASVYRYRLSVEQPAGSLNELVMVLSRLLTPHAVLPKDHVLLENELAHEQPAIFPWAVEIER